MRRTPLFADEYGHAWMNAGEPIDSLSGGIDARLRDILKKAYNGHVEKATVSRLKNNLSAYLRKVRAGQPVVIYDRDLPIARIERIEASGRGADRLALLASQGTTRPAARQLSSRELRTLLPRLLPRSARLLDALIEERAEDR